MKGVIWVGGSFFIHKFSSLGFDVRHVPYQAGKLWGWQELLEYTGFKPEDVWLVLVADVSCPPFVYGMERFPCLTCLYAVDTHVHSWFPYYGQAFDICLISLKEHLKSFTGKYLQDEQIKWFPTYIIPDPSPTETASFEKKDWELLFVGNLDSDNNRPRKDFMYKLKSLLPEFHYTKGSYVELYPRSKLVLNHCIGGELNFRVPESLGCGACLLTPEIEHGLLDLFTDGEDMLTYNSEDMEGLVALVKELLKDDARRIRIARSGHDKVCRFHTAEARAKYLSGLLQEWEASGYARHLLDLRLKSPKSIIERYLKPLYLLNAEVAVGKSRESYLRAAQALRQPG